MNPFTSTASSEDSDDVMRELAEAVDDALNAR